MTRTSNNKLSAIACGLLAMAAGGVAGAQQTGGDRYARDLADAAITARYNTQIEQQIRSQQQEIASLEQQIANLDTTAVDVQAMLQRMYDELVQFVQNDVPFFKEERDQRIERLTELMQNVEASPSEKLRRLMEAYQIEMEYGRTMDSYREMLADGREADFVRLGRVSLMYRTVDGSESGYWDNQRKTWVPAPEYNRAIEEALKIARENINLLPASYNLAAIYAQNGQRDKALQLLRRHFYRYERYQAVRAKEMMEARVDAVFESIRTDREFVALTRGADGKLPIPMKGMPATMASPNR